MDAVISYALDEVALSPTLTGISSARLAVRLRAAHVLALAAAGDAQMTALVEELEKHPEITTTVLEAGELALDADSARAAPRPLVRFAATGALQRRALCLPRHSGITSDQLIILGLVGRRCVCV